MGMKALFVLPLPAAMNIKYKLPRLKGSYGPDSPGLARDRAIVTDPEDTKRRRTIRLSRDAVSRSWGFTLQTYGIRNKKTSEVEVMSYVDYVELHGPAWVAGMRRGDIILSVNGDSVEYSTHMELVQRIKKCRREMRLVVVFENCCKKVELHERYIKLKKLLALKLKELKCLEEEERLISQGVPLSHIAALRRSTSSSISIASDWDAYSEITSPTMLNGTPSNQFVFSNITDSDTSSGSIVLDSSFSCGKGQSQTESESVVSSNPEFGSKDDGNESDSQGFLQSSLSDVSETSDNLEEGLKHMYNITRCAGHITDASKCTNFVPGLGRAGSIDESSKNDSSMSNLVDGNGVQLTAIKASSKRSEHHGRNGVRTSSSASSSSSSPRGYVKRQKGLFYVESDSEESTVSADIERSGSSETSTSSYADSKFSGNSRGHSAISGSVLEQDEDEKDIQNDSCVKNSILSQNDSENTHVKKSHDSNASRKANEANSHSGNTSNHKSATAKVKQYSRLSSSCGDLSIPTYGANATSKGHSSSPSSGHRTAPKVAHVSNSPVKSVTGPNLDDHIPKSGGTSFSSSVKSAGNPAKTCDQSSISGFPQPQGDSKSMTQNQTSAKDQSNSRANTWMREANKSEMTHSRNRLVDGILVNSESQSTRL